MLADLALTHCGPAQPGSIQPLGGLLHTHWNGNIVILTTFSTLVPEVVKMTTSGTSDENVVKIIDMMGNNMDVLSRGYCFHVFWRDGPFFFLFLKIMPLMHVLCSWYSSSRVGTAKVTSTNCTSEHCYVNCMFDELITLSLPRYELTLMSLTISRMVADVPVQKGIRPSAFSNHHVFDIMISQHATCMHINHPYAII